MRFPRFILAGILLLLGAAPSRPPYPTVIVPRTLTAVRVSYPPIVVSKTLTAVSTK